jgi:hypothetical protein
MTIFGNTYLQHVNCCGTKMRRTTHSITECVVWNYRIGCRKRKMIKDHKGKGWEWEDEVNIIQGKEVISPLNCINKEHSFFPKQKSGNWGDKLEKRRWKRRAKRKGEISRRENEKKEVSNNGNRGDGWDLTYYFLWFYPIKIGTPFPRPMIRQPSKV